MLTYIRLGIAAAALAGAFAGGWQFGTAAKNSQIAQLRADHAQAVAASLQAQRERETAIAEKIERIANDTQALQAAIAADARRAAAAASGLRDAAHAVASQCGSRTPPAGGGAATPDPGALLADVLSRMEQAGRDMAAEADRRGAAGAACARAYEAVRR